MTFIEDAQRALAGAWRLFIRDTDGMSQFDTSAQGFFRSFWAIPIAGVFYMVINEAQWQMLVDSPRPELPNETTFWFVGLVSFIVDWLTMPLLMIPLSRMLGLDKGYVPYVVTLNWTGLLATALMALPFGLYLLGLLGAGGAIFFALGLLLVFIHYRWFTTRTALETSSGTAAGLVTVEVLTSLALSMLADRIIGL